MTETAAGALPVLGEWLAALDQCLESRRCRRVDQGAREEEVSWTGALPLFLNIKGSGEASPGPFLG